MDTQSHTTFLVALASLTTFLGSGNVSKELYASARNIFHYKQAQIFVVFSIVFLYTRQIWIAFICTYLTVHIYPEILWTHGFHHVDDNVQ